MGSTRIQSDGVALAFYGGGRVQGTRFGKLFNFVRDFAHSIGRPPTVGYVAYSAKSGKLERFASVLAGTQRRGFRGARGFEMVHVDPDTSIPTYGHVFCCTYSNELVLVAERSHCTLTSGSLLPVARELVDLLHPVYGIGYYRPWKWSPYWYALGLPGGLCEESGDDKPELEEEIMAIARWGDVGCHEKVYKDGIIRDVFPWNFLTSPAMRRRVGSMTLHSWIESDVTRGTLIPISDGMTLWAVPGSSIPHVRQVLWEAGIIFNWRAYI